MDEHAQALLKQLGLDTATQIVLPTLTESQQKRMKLCGSYAIRFDPSTGQPYRIRYRCKLWREGCPLCLKERELEFEKRAIELQRGITQPCIIQRSKEDMDKILRKLRKEHKGVEYWRIPTEDGDILIVDSEVLDTPSDIELEDLDWAELSQTPEGRNYSGRLGKDMPVPDENDETFTVMTYQVIARPGYGDTLTQAAQRALDRTAELDPAFEQEAIEDAWMERHNAFLEEVEAKGGIILESFEKVLTVSKLLYADGWKSSLQKSWLAPYSLDDPRGYDGPQYHPERGN